MPRIFTPSIALRTGFALLLAAGLVAGTLPQRTQAAGGSKQLQRVRGTIGYATTESATDFKQVFAKFDLPDDDYAVTRAKSAAVLAMPDSSLISLGENTSVIVSAFDSAVASPGSTITIGQGVMRFDIRRPEGGRANYIFKTPTSQTAVRGTVGLIGFTNGVTTVACVVCAADSVTVTVGTQTVALATGQFLTVSALGAITTGTLGTVVGAFSAAGVPVTGQVGAVAAGLPAAGAGAAAAGVAVPVVAGAAVAGTAIGIAAGNHSTPQPTATPLPNATPTGSVNLTGHAANAAMPAAAARAPAAAPAARAAPNPHGPPGAPGPGARFGR